MAFETTNLTLFLLAIFASLLIYQRFFAKPNPLVHPLLLGKQSDVSSVRKKGETGVYRSWATGQGSPLTVRPASSLKTVQDIVQGGTSPTSNVPRTILDTTMTDESLIEIIHLLPLGLTQLFNLSHSPTSPTPILTLLPPSPSTSLPLLLLSLSLPPSSPLIILPSPVHLTTALTSKYHPTPGVVVIHADLVDDVLEQVWEDCGKDVGILIVGDPSGVDRKGGSVGDAKEKGMNVRYWEEIWPVAETAQNEKKNVPDSHFSDVHSYYYSNDAEPSVVKVTHINVTAGIAALLSLFPADKRPSPGLKDVVASAIPLNTPIGMTIALASVWSGAGFRMIGSATPDWEEDLDADKQLLALTDESKGPKPTILFLNTQQHLHLVSKLQRILFKHPLKSLMIRNKLFELAEGCVSRSGLLEKYIWSDFRRGFLGGLAGETLRSVVVVGNAPTTDCLGISHILLGLPTTRLHPSPFSTGPIFVSHFNDVQLPSLPNVNHSLLTKIFRPRSHTGAPATNIEVVLKGEGTELDNENKDSGAPLRGDLWIRGPSVLERVDGIYGVEGWTDAKEVASVYTNGTFVCES